jgi:hypothetical protein
VSIRVAGVNWRFDGERSFVTRGGASIGSVQASWPHAELSADSNGAQLRSRPSGLFDDVELTRSEVRAVVVQRGELGNGIVFRCTEDGESDLVFWPTDADAVLGALRERGWPVEA